METLLRIAWIQLVWLRRVSLAEIEIKDHLTALDTAHWLPAHRPSLLPPLPAGSNLCFSCVLLCAHCVHYFCRPVHPAWLTVPSPLQQREQRNGKPRCHRRTHGTRRAAGRGRQHRPRRVRACNWQSGSSSVAGSSSAPPGLPLLTSNVHNREFNCRSLTPEGQ